MPTCPRCQAHYPSGEFLCPICDAILDTTGPRPGIEFHRQPTLVRAVLAPAGTRILPHPPEPPRVNLRHHDPDAPTEPVGAPVVPVPEEAALRLRDVDLEAVSLTPYEAYFLARVDGRTTLGELRSQFGLSKAELATIVRGLEAKGVVVVQEQTLLRRAPRRASASSRVPAVSPTPRSYPAAGAPQLVARARARPVIDRVRLVSPPRSTPERPTEVGPRAAPAEAPPERPPDAPEPRPSHPGPDPSPAALAAGLLEHAVELERAGQWREAVQILEHAIRRARHPAPFYNRLAIVVIEHRREFAEAERLIRLAIGADPRNPVYPQNLLKVLSMAASQTGRTGRRKRR